MTSYLEEVIDIIALLDERSGSSMQAIKKTGGYPLEKFRHVNNAIRKGVEEGVLIKNGGKYKLAATSSNSTTARKARKRRVKNLVQKLEEGKLAAASPARKGKTPAKRVKSLAKEEACKPPTSALSPAKGKAKSPKAKPISSKAKVKSPKAKAKSPKGKTKSPKAGAKSPAKRSPRSVSKT